MTRITIQGIGVVGAFGAGVEALAQALERGESPRTPLIVPTGQGPVELQAFRADTSSLKDFVPSKALRRMDHFTRMGLLGAHLALKDAGLDPAAGGLGLVIASGYGATATTYALLDSIIQDGDTCSSPTAFSSSLHNACAANIAIQLGCTGPNLTVSQFELSVPSALLSACQWLREGRVDRVLFGAIDELSDLTGYLWYRQRGMTGSGPIEPLNAQRDTAIPGEGAAFMLLSRLSEDRPGYCTLEEATTRRVPESLDSSWLMLLNSDGRREMGARYASLAESRRIACATPLYGCMPSGPAFDLAVGALMLKENRCFSSPGSAACDFPAKVVQAGPFEDSRISCLTLSEADGFGLVVLGAMPQG
jgi:3-oxoacyl-[acyl-carrier-protein] synthase II